MHKTITLKTIIDCFLEERGIIANESASYEADYMRLRRQFNRLIERLGSNIEMLKRGGKVIEFDEEEIPFMKILLSQLYNQEGIIDEFISNKKNGFSSDEVHKFIQDLLDEADKEGFEEENLVRMGMFFSGIFEDSSLRIIEYCHKLIDGIALELQVLPIARQVMYLKCFEHILKKEYALQFAGSKLEVGEWADIIEIAKELSGNDRGIQYYDNEDPEIKLLYIQRDKRMLEIIQKDDDFREYIEKKFGKKAEEIFNYAALG